jgi:hypothetical protein
MCPSIGFGNRPISGRSVTLTRSPIASALKVFVSDSNIAIVPPKSHLHQRNIIWALRHGHRTRRFPAAVTLTLFQFNVAPAKDSCDLELFETDDGAR